MDNTVKIRSMRFSEFNKVARLIYDSVHTLCINEYSPEELEAWMPRDLHMPAFRSSLMRCFVIVAVNSKKEIVGVMSTEKDGYVNRLYTRPDWVRRGVASSLLKETEAWAIKRNIKFLSLESSKSAEGFYKCRGFEKIGEMTSVKNNIRFVSSKMRKELLHG